MSAKTKTKTMRSAKRITTAPKVSKREAADRSRLKLIGLIRAHLDALERMVYGGRETFDANTRKAIECYEYAIEDTLSALPVIRDRNDTGSLTNTNSW